jgi:NAD(P)-dependent dehydrogenase (short-subunit alcohol dehydrogenase family)
MDLQLSGRIALVTGSHRGTGQRIAARLADEGATVLVHGFTRAEATASCTTIGCGIAVAGDITTDAGTAELLASCTAAAPPIDILVNNYGTAAAGHWDDTGTDAWIGMYQHNVLSAQRLIRALLPTMRTRKWGRIINLGTVGSTRPAARMPHYYSAKGALATLTMSLAKEVAGAGITVNLVSPGLIHTAEVEAGYLAQGHRNGWGDTWAEIEPHVAADIPIGRIVRRDEVADLIAFLASPRADAIHGQNIRIDGGALGVLT